MKLLLLLWLILMPATLIASPQYVSGIDDINPNIPQEQQDKINGAMTTYYLLPSLQKIQDVLTVINETDLIRKKTAWAPIIGFLTVIFERNKDKVFDWISERDYNSYAANIIVNALLNAELYETASIFAQANQWTDERVKEVRAYDRKINFKTIDIVLPSHIDSVWGAFFASGDKAYVSHIIDVLFMEKLPFSTTVQVPMGKDVLGENKALAKKTLNYYATQHKAVRDAIQQRLKKERAAEKISTLKALLP